MERLLNSRNGPFVCGVSFTYADISLYEFLLYAAEALSLVAEEMLHGFPEVLCQFRAVHAFDHFQAYLRSPRRKPLPDDVFIRQVTSILSLPLPAHLQENSHTCTGKLKKQWLFCLSRPRNAARHHMAVTSIFIMWPARIFSICLRMYFLRLPNISFSAFAPYCMFCFWPILYLLPCVLAASL